MIWHEITHLRKNGFEVLEQTPWHYQMVSGKTVINIWPTKRKWMVAYDSGASFYEDAGDLLRIVQEKTQPYVRPVMPPITEAEEEWRDGLNEVSYQIAELII